MVIRLCFERKTEGRASCTSHRLGDERFAFVSLVCRLNEQVSSR